MTSKVKTLIIGAVVVVLLVAVLVVLKVTEPKKQDEGTSSSSSDISQDALIDEKLDNYKSIKVKNSSSEYSIKSVEIQGADGEKDYKYVINELEKYTQKESSVTSLVSNVNKLYSSSKIEDKVEDLSKYGLDKPSSVVTYETVDKTYTINVGSEAPDGSFYTMIDGDEALYTIDSSIANLFNSNYVDFLDTTLIPAETETLEDGTTQTPKITSFELERSDLPAKIKLLPNDNTEQLAYSSIYKMVSPIESDINYQIDSEYMAKIFGMSASKVEAIYDSSKASEYGFDKPTAKFTVQYSGKTKTITVGNKAESGEYRVLVDNNGLVYNASEETLVFMTVTADDMISGLAIVPSITDVKTVNVMLDGKTYKYDLTNEKVKDEDSGEESLQTTKVVYDGKELDLDIFRKYYQLLLSASVEKINYDNTKGDLVASIEYLYTDGGSDKIELYQAENRRMIVAINGEAKYEGRIAYYDKLVKETQNLLSGKAVDTDW